MRTSSSSSTRRWLYAAAMVCGIAALAPTPAAAAAGAGHEAFSTLLIGLAIILPTARVSGILAEKIGQPAVLGELMLGIVLGNLDLFGVVYLDRIAADHGIGLLAELGVVLLLFEVGLDSSLGKLLKVGLPSLLVALIGVILPIGLGFAAGRILLPETEVYVALFLGATLAATSVGITARVLKDLGHLQDDDSQVILGAAVIDDVLGLVVLAIVSGLVTAASQGTEMEAVTVLLLVLKAAAFLVGVLIAGVYIGGRVLAMAANRGASPLLFAVSLGLCFALAWGAGTIGLAPIIGAFAGGLILESIPWRKTSVRQEQVFDLLHPFNLTLVPLFFVVTGMKVDLAAAANLEVLQLTVVLAAIAFVGKLAAGWGAIGPHNKFRIGLGMVPRGEVGLIFANIGAQLQLNGRPLLPPALFSAIVLVIFITTLVTPPALRATYGPVSR